MAGVTAPIADVRTGGRTAGQRAGAQLRPFARTCALRRPAGGAFCCPGCAAAHEHHPGPRVWAATTSSACWTSVPGRCGRNRRSAGTSPAMSSPAGWHAGTHARRRRAAMRRLRLADRIGAGEASPDVLAGRVNMTTRRLRLAWRGAACGRRPPGRGGSRRWATGWCRSTCPRWRPRRTRPGGCCCAALAVAGFAAGNVMLISIGIWAGQGGVLDHIGPATVALLHWVSALIAMPADRLCRPAVLRAPRCAALRQRPHQYGRADQHRRAAGHRHEPGAKRSGAAPTPISIPPSRCCSSC